VKKPEFSVPFVKRPEIDDSFRELVSNLVKNYHKWNEAELSLLGTKEILRRFKIQRGRLCQELTWYLRRPLLIHEVEFVTKVLDNHVFSNVRW